MFKVSISFDYAKYEYKLETYKEAISLSQRLLKLAGRYFDNYAIEGFCIEIELI